MAKPNTDRDLESLISETEKQRIRMRKEFEKAENLAAAIESAKEAKKPIKPSRPDSRET